MFTRETIERITAPSLFLWGDEDPVGGATTAELFTGRFSNATLEMVPGAGHAPWIDEPELCARQIREFFA